MTDILLAIVFVIIFIGGPFWLIYKMHKHVAKKGALFTGQTTRGMKVFAIVLGILFAGLFIMGFLSSQPIPLMFPILAFALLGYGLGAGRLLNKLQNRSDGASSTTQSSTNNESSIGSLDQGEMKLFSQNRHVRFGVTLAIILVISVIFLYGAWWDSTHPDNPIAWVFVIGIVLFLVSAQILDWFKFLRNLFK